MAFLMIDIDDAYIYMRVYRYAIKFTDISVKQYLYKSTRTRGIWGFNCVLVYIVTTIRIYLCRRQMGFVSHDFISSV